MRNLKKVLTLVLTVAMVLSIMVVGTGAAFSDQDQIKNKEAVDVCTTLNIIAGMEDGSYRPANNVTRAQMCKMICVALNGGKEPTLGTNATPTFSDVRTDPSSSWAESFIESCNSQGIVSGVGGGRFSPSGSVTGTQAARMLLVALGYRADQEGFTGDSWAINVNTRASAKGLYAGIEGIDANAALSRDNAAQMIWNALNAYEVEYVSQLTTVNGQLTSKLVAQDKVVGQTTDKITLVEDKYEAITRTGTLKTVKFDSEDNTYTTIVNAGKDVNNNPLCPTFDSTKDYSALIGQQVKAMYTYDNKTHDTVLLGIYATDRNKVVTALVDDVDTKANIASADIEIDDVTYKFDSAVIVAPNGEPITKVSGGNTVAITGADLQNYHEISLIDNDKDGKYEYVVVNPFVVDEVTSLTSKKIYFDNHAALNNEDCDMYDGIAKNDFVIISDEDYTVSGMNELVKAEVISGKVSAVKTDNSFRIDGTWYQKAAGTTPKAGDTMNAAVVVNGFYFDTDTSSKGSVSGTVVVLAVNSSKDWNGDYYDANLLFADGTTMTTKAVVAGTDGKADKTPAGKPSDAKIYTYEKKDDGYLLTEVKSGSAIDVGTNTAENALTGKVYSSKANQIGTWTDPTFTAQTRVATDAVVFVKYDGTKGAVVTGAAADAWSDSYTHVPVTIAFADKTVEIMYLNMSDSSKVPGASSKASYAFILSDVMDAEDDDKIADLWTSNGLATEAIIKGVADATRYMVYEYTMDGDEYDLTKFTAWDGTAEEGYVLGAVTDIDGNYITVKYMSSSTVMTKEFKVTDDTTWLYVDSKDGSGSDSGKLIEATEYEADKYYTNVIIVIDDDDATAADVEVGAIVVDLDNSMRDSTTKKTGEVKAP